MSNFFDKLGRSLNLEDEQVPPFAYDNAKEEISEEEENGDSEEDMENVLDDDTLDELMSQEQDDNGNMGAVATLASSDVDMKKSANINRTKAAQKTKLKTDVLLEEGRLNIDVYESDDEIVIKSAIAGVGDDDLDIDITSDSVSIRGERQMDEETSEDDYFYKECYWGAFSREVRLHTEIDPDKAEATLKNGILTIRLPKLSKTKQKKLKVKKVI
jgi:HSP20 family protein